MDSPPTPLDHLLSIISWEGSGVRLYRRGGRGLENVLTLDVLSALNLLPREHFLGSVLQSIHWNNDKAYRAILTEVEDLELSVFPNAHSLRPSAETHQERLEVQPDARLLSPSVFALLEAKRIKTSSFQPEQLARNLLVLLRDCEGRLPILLLVLGKPPPVTVKRHGRKTLPAAIETGLESAYQKIEG